MLEDLTALFERDLERCAELIEQYPSDEKPWEAHAGFPNPSGNLALHLEGNLKYFIGAQLGGYEFEREREHEFNGSGHSREELAQRLRSTRQMVKDTLSELPPEKLEETYPLKLFGAPMTTRYFLYHLYGHLNYHRGQMNYHLRAVIPS